MAGVASNNAWIAYQAQGATGSTKLAQGTKAKTTPVATKGTRSGVTGGSITSSREIGHLAETDANRDQGVVYLKKDELKGSPELYVRRKGCVPFFWGALGNIASTETTPPKVEHAITPGNVLPYFTFWSAFNTGTGGSEGEKELYEEFINCVIADINLKGAAGNPLSITATVLGTETKKWATNPLVASEPTMENDTPYVFSNAKVELGGAATHLINDIDFSLSNNAVAQQTDKPYPFDIGIGKRTVSCGFSIILENIEEYNEFHYANKKKTGEMEIAPGIYETKLKFTFEIDASNSIEIYLPHVAYEEYPITPNADGAPMVVPVKAVGQRSSEDIVKVTIKNEKKVYG